MTSPEVTTSARDFYDTEAVAFRIGEYDVVGGPRSHFPMDLCRAQPGRALDLAGLVLGVQVDTRRDLGLRNG